MMDYDSYDFYERNSPADYREEAEFARDRVRRFDRERRERESDLQWERDRNWERQRLTNARGDYDERDKVYRERSRKYEDSDYPSKTDLWDGGQSVATFDYNHGMVEVSEVASKDLSRSESSQFDSGNQSQEHILCDIKQEPTCTIFLGGISRTIDEKDIENELRRCGIRSRDIRIIRQKDTGANRGFAFVDFHSVADAQAWMEMNQGRLFLRNRYPITMDYSRSANPGGSGTASASGRADGGGSTSGSGSAGRTDSASSGRTGRSDSAVRTNSTSSESIYDSIAKDDWKCAKCGCDNFKKRVRCFVCTIPKEESEKLAANAKTANCPTQSVVERRGILKNDSSPAKPRNPADKTVEGCKKSSAESRNPPPINGSSSTLIIHGLDGLTSEAAVTEALEKVGVKFIRNMFIARNEKTGIGQGYGYIELRSVADAYDLVELLRTTNTLLEIDGKEVAVEYSKEQFDNLMLLRDGLKFGIRAYSNRFSAKHYQPLGHHKSHYVQQAVSQEPTTQSNTSTVSVSSSSAAESTALVTSSGTTTCNLEDEFSNYAPPDLNRYTFDDLTGYYIDPMTGLYYDAGTQYFYHMETGNFLYWDPDRSCYVVVSNNQDASNVEYATAPVSEYKSKQEEERQKRADEAKKIARDMEKWAKGQNAHKEKDSGFKKPLAPISLPPKPKPSGAADVGFSIFTKAKLSVDLSRQRDEKNYNSSPLMAGLVAYGGDSDSETEGDDQDEPTSVRDAERLVDEKLIDRSKKMCLLCRRAFATIEILEKHQLMSDLHKKNLDEYRRNLTGTVTRASTVGIAKAGTTRKR